MKKHLFLSVLLVGLLVSANAFSHGKFINISLSGNAAYPLGSELTSQTAPSPGLCDSSDPAHANKVYTCNPAYFGAGGGLGVDIQLPYHLGIGVEFYYHVFLRKEEPKDTPTETNLSSKSPFQDIKLYIPLTFRVLDIVPSYKRKWGTLIIGAAPGIGWLYQTVHIAVKAGIAYLYPVYDKGIFGLQIGVAVDFVYQHPFGGDYPYVDDMYLAFGLRFEFGVMDTPWGKKKKPGEAEEQMGELVSDEMKKKDSDGDGLNDYCELMLGTDPKQKDSDNDGLFDSEEDKNKNCMRDSGESDPAVEDTDGGGAPDGWEAKAEYDPLNPDDDDKDQDFITDNVDNCLGTPRGIAVNERGCPTLVETTVLDGVTFQPGAAELAEGAQASLDNWVAVLQDNPELKFDIVGYTDSKGNKKKLQKLSEDRARFIFDYFVSKGISEARMSSKGLGIENPIGSNKTEEGRAANNRIEVVPLEE
ncbi:MAG: OmpA family protein [Pseudomonadota bacterium]